MNITPTFRVVLWIRGDICIKHPAPCLAGDRKATNTEGLVISNLILNSIQENHFQDTTILQG